MIPPKYVEMGLRLRTNWLGEEEYYRDGGNWSINFIIKDDNVYSDCPHLPYMHNKLLKPISYEEWAKSNKGYI